MSIHEVSAKLHSKNIKHIVVLGMSTNQVKDIVDAFKALQKDCLKAHGAPYELDEQVGKINKLLHAYPESLHNTDAPTELTALTKTCMSIAQTVFPQPAIKELSDSRKGKFYTSMSKFRALSRFDAKKVEQAKTTQEVLSELLDFANGVASRDDTLNHLAQDLQD